tara:strand:- start:513 stop:965 length:453 start_codon:yes stop_codon:yes gene_type:complete
MSVKSSPSPSASKAGFSLLELMVVLVIIGLLATIVVINVLPSQDRAMVEKARADIATLEQAVELYRLDMLSFPSTEQGLDALITPPSDPRNAVRFREGGYIRRLPTDPWGYDYLYLQPGEHGPVDIYSLGRDGRVGGEGQDADIGNWTAE